MIMLDLSRAPARVRQLLAWLVDQDFQVTGEEIGDSFNQNVIFTADDRTVRVNATRGDWALGIGLGGETFHPEQWEAWLDDYPLAGDLADLDHQVGFIVHRWQTAIEQACERPGAIDEIRAIGDDWVFRKFGFSPRVLPDHETT